MAEELDNVARYGRALGWTVRPKTILVEGTTDAYIFELAARLELEATGQNLLGSNLAIIAAGDGDRGGTQGVIRELISLRSFSRTCLTKGGRPIYRFIGLFDNDKAGQQAVRAATNLDASVIEFRDLFRLHPYMPTSGNLDPKTLQKAFERDNAACKGLPWEIEDSLPEHFFDALAAEHPNAILRLIEKGDKVHRELTRDGKAILHKMVRQYANRDDLSGIISILRAFHFYCSISPSALSTQ